MSAWRQTTGRAAAPRAWQRMLSGRRLDLLDPSPFDVEIEDIAHGLSRVARWNGQTRGDWPFSVAQHSLVVEAIASRLAPQAPAADRLAALLHDAPEYVVGDLISPFKAVIGDPYRGVEARIARAVHLRFGLPAEPAAECLRLIKTADQAAAYMEAVTLAGFDEAEAGRIFRRPQRAALPAREALAPLPTGEVEARFLERFHALHDDLDQ